MFFKNIGWFFKNCIICFTHNTICNFLNFSGKMLNVIKNTVLLIKLCLVYKSKCTLLFITWTVFSAQLTKYLIILLTVQQAPHIYIYIRKLIEIASRIPCNDHACFLGIYCWIIIIMYKIDFGIFEFFRNITALITELIPGTAQMLLGKLKSTPSINNPSILYLFGTIFLLSNLVMFM